MATVLDVECSSDENQSNGQNQVNSELVKHLIVTGKGSFKRKGEFDSLKQFIDGILEEETKMVDAWWRL